MTYIVVFSFYRKYINNLTNIVKKISDSVGAYGIVVVYQCEEVVGKIIHGNVEYIKNNNINWEFGAYQQGLNFIRNKISLGDSVIIMNDTVGLHTVFDKYVCDRFCWAHKESMKSTVPYIVGEIDSADQIYKIKNMSAKYWVRSCIISMNYQAIAAINFKIDFDFDGFIDIGFDKEGKLKLSIESCDSGLENFISKWLDPSGGHSGWVGATSKKIDHENIKRKVICILKERLIYLNLDGKNSTFVNFLPKSTLGIIIYRCKRKLQTFNRLRRSNG